MTPDLVDVKAHALDVSEKIAMTYLVGKDSALGLNVTLLLLELMVDVLRMAERTDDLAKLRQIVIEMTKPSPIKNRTTKRGSRSVH